MKEGAKSREKRLLKGYRLEVLTITRLEVRRHPPRRPSGVGRCPKRPSPPAAPVERRRLDTPPKRVPGHRSPETRSASTPVRLLNPAKDFWSAQV